MLNVVTWLWRGWRPVYRPEHVLAVRNMLQKYLNMPHRFICVTDEHVPGVECIPNWHCPIRSKKGALPDCYRRLKLFAMPGEWLSIDLDCLILDDITELVQEARQHDFKALKGTVSDYNGSIWYTKGQVRPDIWENLSVDLIDKAKKDRGPRGRKPIGSDQVIMSHMIKGAPTWSEEDGLYQHVRTPRKLMDRPRIVFFAGGKKPWGVNEYLEEYSKYTHTG